MGWSHFGHSGTGSEAGTDVPLMNPPPVGRPITYPFAELARGPCASPQHLARVVQGCRQWRSVELMPLGRSASPNR